jgi:2-phospho-L-lactate/phosphoenolpyruvate guanylyltransferase
MSLTLLSELPQRLQRRLGCCALIAVKQRVLGKSRLAARLGVQARIALVRTMLARVLAAAAGAQTVRQIIVVSPERDTVDESVPVLADSGAGLNVALAQAQRALLEFGVRELLVLPADLPFVTGAEIDALVRAGRGAGFAIAPDAADIGTNALCLAMDHPFEFQFGPESKRAHLRAAQRLGLAPQVLRLPGLEFDVDSPADLQRFEEWPWPAQQRT